MFSLSENVGSLKMETFVHLAVHEMRNICLHLDTSKASNMPLSFILLMLY